MRIHMISHRAKLLLQDAWNHKDPIDIHCTLLCRNARALKISHNTLLVTEQVFLGCSHLQVCLHLIVY